MAATTPAGAAAPIVITPTSAGPGPAGSQWHIDYTFTIGSLTSADAATTVGWSTGGVANYFEIDVDNDGVNLQWTCGDGTFGSAQFYTSIADGQSHRVHIDEVQQGADIQMTVAIAGRFSKPVIIPGKTSGRIVSAIPNARPSLKPTTKNALITNLSVWSQ